MAHDGEAARDGVGPLAGALCEVVDEARPGTVDDLVGDRGDDDLAAQQVMGNGRRELLAQRRREVVHQVMFEQTFVGQVGLHQRVVERELGMGQQHRHLGPRQARGPTWRAGRWCPRRAGRRRVRLTRPSRSSARIRRCMLVSRSERFRLGDRERLGLQVVVAQHQLADLVGHVGEQLVARLHGELLGRHRLVQQDLDVDLVIGGIDTRRVVDGIGVEPSARARVFDAPAWVMARLAPSPTTLQRSSRPSDAERVVGAVARVRLGLVRRLDEGADAAEPQQLHLGSEQAADQLVGRQRVGGDAEARLDLAPRAGSTWPNARRRRRPWRSACGRSPSRSSAAC